MYMLLTRQSGKLSRIKMTVGAKAIKGSIGTPPSQPPGPQGTSMVTSWCNSAKIICFEGQNVCYTSSPAPAVLQEASAGLPNGCLVIDGLCLASWDTLSPVSCHQHTTRNNMWRIDMPRAYHARQRHCVRRQSAGGRRADTQEHHCAFSSNQQASAYPQHPRRVGANNGRVAYLLGLHAT